MGFDLRTVPWITQKAKGYEDPTGCWYASACMIGYFFEAGPRLGAPTLFTRPLSDGRLGHWATGSKGAKAANKSHHEDFAKNEGFEAVDNCRTAYVYRLDEIESLLKKHGPIFMYWWKGKGTGLPVHRSERKNKAHYGHASVIVGTDSSGLIFHDPEYEKEKDGANRKLSLADFNAARQTWKWALMQRAGVNTIKVRKRMLGL